VFYLDKLLSQLAYPLGLALTLVSLAWLLLLLGRRRLGLISLALGILWLFFWSMPSVSDRLRLSLEGQLIAAPVETLPALDALVVLGGGIRGAPPGWSYPDLGRAADRVWHAARLYHAGKAPRIILSGGSQPWLGERGDEANAMREFLVDLGVPRKAILIESRSRNTRENAVYTRELMRESGIERVFLVTSALHMPRALGTFRAAGIEAVPAPADFEVMPETAHPLRWMPDAEALQDSSRALKEYLGWWVYRWRGWAEP
jgi:uncharacterized SAM-binding protein YcdF (DUF218 family)